MHAMDACSFVCRSTVLGLSSHASDLTCHVQLAIALLPDGWQFQGGMRSRHAMDALHLSRVPFHHPTGSVGFTSLCLTLHCRLAALPDWLDTCPAVRPFGSTNGILHRPLVLPKPPLADLLLDHKLFLMWLRDGRISWDSARARRVRLPARAAACP